MELIEEFVAFKLYRRPPDPVKCLVDREDQSQGVVIKLYHNTENGIFNSSDSMEEPLKNQKNIVFSGSGASHKI